MLEAVLWERARGLARGKRAVNWLDIATMIEADLDAKWPVRLSSRTAAKI